MRWVLLIPLLFLVACQPTECPPCRYPTCTCPECPTLEDLKDKVEVHFIDVGQGDSILVKYTDTEMLIDCGKTSKGADVVEYLKEQNVTQLEYLLITHGDLDHYGGCKAVLNYTDARMIIYNGEDKDSLTYKRFINDVKDELFIAQAGDDWEIGPATIEVLQTSRDKEITNHNSIITKLTYNSTSVLFTGDCDSSCERELMDKDIRSDILKVPHHGSKYGTSVSFLAEVKPDIAVISVGISNTYGHPAQELLDRLRQDGILIYRTDYDEDVVIQIGEGGYKVK